MTTTIIAFQTQVFTPEVVNEVVYSLPSKWSFSQANQTLCGNVLLQSSYQSTYLWYSKPELAPWDAMLIIESIVPF